MDGNTAAAHVAYAYTEVAGIYPITPSSPMEMCIRARYGLSYDDAIALYNIDAGDDYTLALTQKLNELGIKEETK